MVSQVCWQVGACGDAKFAEGVMQVGFDGGLGDEQVLGDLPVGKAGSECPQARLLPTPTSAPGTAWDGDGDWTGHVGPCWVQGGAGGLVLQASLSMLVCAG